jgi:hypothetical protein
MSKGKEFILDMSYPDILKKNPEEAFQQYHELVNIGHIILDEIIKADEDKLWSLFSGLLVLALSDVKITLLNGGIDNVQDSLMELAHNSCAETLIAAIFALGVGVGQSLEE